MTPIHARRGVLRKSLLATLLAPLLVLGFASTAQAEDAFRYWTYWWGQDGSWTYASTGPADQVVEDQSVEGWLLQVTADPEPTKQPAEQPDYAALCPEAAEPGDGQVRVAVVIDYGSAEDAPEGETPPAPVAECVEVAEGSTADVALTEAADVRSENGATCGINGYPAQGCFEQVTAIPAESASPGSDATDEATATAEPSPRQ